MGGHRRPQLWDPFGREGEIVSIVGRPAAGKTKLINYLGVLNADSGSIRWHGRGCRSQQRMSATCAKGLVHAMADGRSATPLLGLAIRGVASGEARIAAARCFGPARTHMASPTLSFHAIRAACASRVALARPWSTSPVFVVDEPFAALDFQSKVFIEKRYGGAGPAKPAPFADNRMI